MASVRLDATLKVGSTSSQLSILVEDPVGVKHINVGWSWRYDATALPAVARASLGGRGRKSVATSESLVVPRPARAPGTGGAQLH